MAGSTGWKLLAVLASLALLLITLQLLQGEESVAGFADSRKRPRAYSSVDTLCPNAAQLIEETIALQLTLDPGLFHFRSHGVGSILERLAFHTGQALVAEEVVEQVRWQRYVRTKNCGEPRSLRMLEELTRKGEETGTLALELKYGHRATFAEGVANYNGPIEDTKEACDLPFGLNYSLVGSKSSQTVEHEQHLCGRKLTRVSRAYVPELFLPLGMSEGEISCKQIREAFPDVFQTALSAETMAEAQEPTVWFVHREEGIRLQTESGSILYCDLEFTLHYRNAKEAKEGMLWPIGSETTSDSEFNWRIYLSRSLLTASDAKAARAFLEPKKAPVESEAAEAGPFLSEIFGWYSELARDFGSFQESMLCTGY